MIWAIANDVILILFCSCSLLLYRNTISLCTITFYPVTFPSSISCRSFFKEDSFRIYKCIVMFSVSKSSFTSNLYAFLFLVLLYFLGPLRQCWIQMINHSYLLLNFVQIFPLSKILVVEVLLMLFIGYKSSL